jgi:hypothetical protein
MAETTQTDTESQVRLWIKKNKKENSRIEFKLRVDVGTHATKAEFIRDVLSLANSEGEHPRTHGYLVIGFKNGRHRDVGDKHYDGATLGQILDSYIYPPIDVAYEEYGNKAQPRIGVLIVKPDPGSLYVVNKRLLDEKGQPLLVPGQCWGRKSDRKIELTGEAIHIRLRDIVDCRIEEATHPLRKRIGKLEGESGPVLEVKRIRFEMEAISGWSAVEAYLQKLIPYAREFDHIVKHEVLNAVIDATGRTRQGMPLDVAQAVGAVLTEVMPIKGGGFHHPAREQASEDDKELFQRVENATFELTWDACRYLRDLKIVEIGARLYWMLIRYSTLNRLQRLQTEALHNARYCRDICMEDRIGKTFPEGHEKLDKQIEDALDAFECEGYEIKATRSKDLTASELAACVAILKTGDAVSWESAKNELPLATALAIARKDKQVVGLGAIKRQRRRYAADIAKKCGVEFPPETLELGYVAVSPDHWGHHLSHCIVRRLIKQHGGRLFATTYSPQMKEALKRFAFVNKGKEWPGRKRQMISFWENE